MKPNGSNHPHCLGSLPTPEMSPMEQEDLQLDETRHGAVFQLVHKFSSASAFLRSVSHPYRPTMMANVGDAHYSMQFFNNGGNNGEFYQPTSYPDENGSYQQASSGYDPAASSHYSPHKSDPSK